MHTSSARVLVAVASAMLALSCSDDGGSSKGDPNDAGRIADSGKGSGGGAGDSSQLATCAGSETVCGMQCAELSSDPRHCGKCGHACAAGEVCSQGACETLCAAGLVKCGAACVDPEQDRNHCGASATCSGNRAGAKCASGSLCSAGKCALSCQPGLIDCDGRCIDPKSDREHCGASGECAAATDDAGTRGTRGAVCKAGEVCSEGTCTLTCSASRLSCNGDCIDPATDAQYCGASASCSPADASSGTICKQGERCEAGNCQLSCPAGQLECAGKCIDPKTDNLHCGAALDCFGANAGEACVQGEVCNGNGACEVTCAADRVRCGTSCIDPKTDRTHCGADGACTGTSAGKVCDPGYLCDGSGACALTCSGDLIACDDRCIDPKTHHTRCGASADCASANAGTTCDSDELCTNGACLARCAPGRVFCDGRCIDPLVDRQSCGASGSCGGLNAGTACASNQVCNGAGACTSTCAAGFELCGGQCVASGTCPACGSGGICNPKDLGGASCASLGLGNGTLLCDPATCTYDSSLCTTDDAGGVGGAGG